jgi:hypothetical protein
MSPDGWPETDPPRIRNMHDVHPCRLRCARECHVRDIPHRIGATRDVSLQHRAARPVNRAKARRITGFHDFLTPHLQCLAHQGSAIPVPGAVCGPLPAPFPAKNDLRSRHAPGRKP